MGRFSSLLLVLPLLAGCVQEMGSSLPDALDLGTSSEGDACRAGKRLDTEAVGALARYDVFCGTWRRPAATIDVYPKGVTLSNGLLAECASSTGTAALAESALTCPGLVSGTLLQDLAITAVGADMLVQARGIPGALPAMRRWN